MPPKDEKKLASAGEVMRVYMRYLGRHKPIIFALLVISIAIQAVDVIAPLFMRSFFNILSTGTPTAATQQALFITLSLVALMWLLDWATRRIQDVFNTFLTEKVMRRLYTDSFEYLMGHSYNFFSSNFAGTLTHRVGRFARSFENIFDTILLQFLPTGLFILGAAGVLFVHNRVLGAALFIWAALFVWFQVMIAKWRQPSRAARAEADTKITATLSDAIANQSTVSQFAGKRHEESIFDHVVDLWGIATIKSWLVDTWTWGAIGLFVIVIQVGLLWGAIIYWQRGLLTLGDFVLIQAYLLGAFNQLMGMGYQLRQFYNSFADAGEMVYVLNQPHEIVDAPGAKTLVVSHAEVEFDKVFFNFGKRVVLDNFNVFVPGGQKVALVGPSGAGKSTVTKLLLRFFDVEKGAITIDGKNIKEVTQDSLRSAISYVPQEPVLFHRSLKDNIRYGKRNATDEEVVAAAKAAHCHDFIMQLPQKYDTFVGERGIKLSGGERQRVAIARAILKNAPILVLDEATSSLDSESEELIQNALEVLMQNKTVIVIAHRLSTIMQMDRILVLEQGKVVADGTHEELLAEEGLYKKLWSIQAGGFLVAEEKLEDEAVDEETQPDKRTSAAEDAEDDEEDEIEEKHERIIESLAKPPKNK